MYPENLWQASTPPSQHFAVNVEMCCWDEGNGLEYHVASSKQTWTKSCGWFLFPVAERKIWPHSNDLICIDSTHNATKLIPQFGAKKLSTCTLLLRQPKTSKGLPVTWFLNADKSVYDIASVIELSNILIICEYIDHYIRITAAKVQPQSSP